MHGIILVAGAIIALSLGFVLAGFILSEAIRNSRRRATSQTTYRTRLVTDKYSQPSALGHSVFRGYDTPELRREDSLARTKQSSNDREYQ
jgi:hypothetical protein